MKPRLLIALVGLSSCASVAEQRDADAREVGSVVERRIGTDVLQLRANSAAAESAVKQLLAEPLTDDSVVKIALLANPRVRVELEELGIASAELVRAGLIDNPVLTFTSKSFDSGTELEIAVVQPFVDLLFLSSRKRVGEAQLDAAKARVASKLVGLAFDAQRALVRVRAAQRLVAVEQEVEQAARASFELMQVLHAAGNVTDPARTAEELSLARARIAVLDAQAELPEAREELGVLLGLADAQDWHVDGEFDEELPSAATIEDVVPLALSTSFELAATSADADIAARRAGVENWRTLIGDAQIGIAAKREHSDGEWGFGPDLALSVPLWDFGGAQRSLAAAHIEQALAAHELATIEVSSAARRLVARLESLLARAELVRAQEQPAATRLVRETLRDYNAMQIGVFDVLVVKQRESDARRRYVEANRDAQLARLDIDELLAGSLNRDRVVSRTSASGHATIEATTTGGH